MSHRIKRFLAFAIFALFYLVAGLDSILSLLGRQENQPNDEIKSSRRCAFWCPHELSLDESEQTKDLAMRIRCTLR